jgi:hypothetical protein
VFDGKSVTPFRSRTSLRRAAIDEIERCIPIIDELSWLLVGIICLKIFLWLYPPDIVREHIKSNRFMRSTGSAFRRGLCGSCFPS